MLVPVVLRRITGALDRKYQVLGYTEGIYPFMGLPKIDERPLSGQQLFLRQVRNDARVYINHLRLKVHFCKIRKDSLSPMVRQVETQSDYLESLDGQGTHVWIQLVDHFHTFRSEGELQSTRAGTHAREA